MVQEIQTQVLELGTDRIPLISITRYAIHTGKFEVDITDVKLPSFNNYKISSLSGRSANICGRLMGLVDEYKCSTILSKSVLENSSSHLHKRCRMIDRISPRSFDDVIDIFSFDCNNTSKQFIQSFNQGLKEYLDGNWK